MKKKVWPLLVSAGSAVVMLVTFFIPSIQDQWDRYNSRQIIQQFVEIGDDLMQEENYSLALAAYTRAFELSEEQRLDIEVKRLSAKVNLIYMNAEWGSKPPEDLGDADFQFLIHMQKGPDKDSTRSEILNSYCVYLASLGKTKEAEQAIREAISLTPGEGIGYINLGNLMDQVGKKHDAELAYKKGIELGPNCARAHYNLGLLYAEQKKFIEAESEFAATLKIEPTDSDAIEQHAMILEEIKLKRNSSLH